MSEGAEEGESAPGRQLRQLRDLPVDVLASLSAKKADALATWGVANVLDLLTKYPRRYIDRSRQADLAELAVGEQAVVLAEVRRVGQRRARNGRAIVELAVHDGTGAMKVVFFNQPAPRRSSSASSTSTAVRARW